MNNDSNKVLIAKDIDEHSHDEFTEDEVEVILKAFVIW